MGVRHETRRRTTGAALARVALCGLALSGLADATFAQSSSPWPERPNILWLVAEDLGPYVPPFGDDTVETPTLTRLAAEGVRYTNVFSPSGVCAPSRAALATGLYPTQIGAQHMRTGPWASPRHPEVNRRSPLEGLVFYEAVPPADVRMHSEWLRRAGYYTANNAKEDYQFRKPVTAWDESGSEAHWRNREPGQPFFAIFNLNVTHESQIWARADQPLLLAADADVPVPPYLPRTEVALRDIRRMYSNVVEMDRQAGKILAELEEDGLLENTIVFWYTDHGGPLPRQKRLLYDSGLRAPTIIRYPNRWRAGEIDEQLVSFVDFKPTLLSMAGVDVPSYVAGRVFVGAGVDTPARRYVHAAGDRFDEAYDGSRAVGDGRFKYIRHLETERAYYLPLQYREQMPIMQELLRLRDAGELDPVQAQWFRPRRPKEELFDTAEDPHEIRDVAGDPRFADKLAELRRECDRWLAATEDRGLMPEADFLETIWPGQVQPRTAAPKARRVDGGWELTSATPGASIGYQILAPGEAPGDRWAVYTGRLVVPPGRRLVATAHRIGFAPSDVTEASGP